MQNITKQDWWMTANNCKPTKKWKEKLIIRDIQMQDIKELIDQLTPIIFKFAEEHRELESMCYDYAVEQFWAHPLTSNLTKDQCEDAREELLTRLDLHLTPED